MFGNLHGLPVRFGILLSNVEQFSQVVDKTGKQFTHTQNAITFSPKILGNFG